MAAYLIKRLWHMVLIVFGVSLVTFLVLHLTGDPVALYLPPDASPEDVATMRHALGLDRPLWEQYWHFLVNALHGNFGQSLRHHAAAFPLVIQHLPATLELTLGGMLVAVALGVPLGILAATRRNSLLDNICSVVGLLGQSMPTFWLGIMLILYLAVRHRLFPASGSGSLSNLVLPSLSIGAYSAALIMRLLRSSMLEVLGQDFVRTARAKGLRERWVIYKHALRNALLPVVTVVGLQFGSLLGGAVIVETIFAWPGMGQFAIQAINDRDTPVVQATVFVFALLVVLVNLLTDLVYMVIDPRVKLN